MQTLPLLFRVHRHLPLQHHILLVLPEYFPLPILRLCLPLPVHLLPLPLLLLPIRHIRMVVAMVVVVLFFRLLVTVLLIGLWVLRPLVEGVLMCGVV